MVSIGGNVVEVASRMSEVIEFPEREVVVFTDLVNVAGASVRAIAAILLEELRLPVKVDSVPVALVGVSGSKVTAVAAAREKVREAVWQQCALFKS